MSMREKMAKAMAGRAAYVWDQMNDGERLRWFAYADAVLDALMEPTIGMIKAVEEDYYMGKKGCPTCGGGRPAFTALIRAAKEGK